MAQAVTHESTFRFNDSFKGRVPDIEGPDEDTAIYLLQGLKRSREQEAKVEALLADGFEEIDSVEDRKRFSHIVLVPKHRNGGEWREYADARLIIADTDRTPGAVLPKGHRTRGELISGRRVLVKA